MKKASRFRNAKPSLAPDHEGMTLVPGGEYTMGSDQFYPEERPRRQVRVDPFWIDVTPVTNRQFAAFVEETGYRTVAEIAPDPRDYPGLAPENAVAGSLVFQPTEGPVPLWDHTQWWSFVPGADWRHPLGPGSGIDELMDHPVVQVAYEDAEAYAKWAGKALPTEAEWEFAARGGLTDAEFAWGDELEPDGAVLANYWRGTFPFETLKEDGNIRTTPVRRYPANGYGIHDMIGNVWEWTRDWYALPPAGEIKSGCCSTPNPRGGTLGGSYEPGGLKIGRRVLKGGSHLCAANYCQRYRPAARHAQAVDSSTGHLGFRCVSRAGTGRT